MESVMIGKQQIKKDSPGGWTFILTPLNFTRSLPYVISPGLVINKANKSQIAQIKDKFEYFRIFSFPQHFYEFELQKSNENPNWFVPVSLNEEDWRYFVIEFDDDKKLADLHYASHISDLKLDICSLYFYNSGGFSLRLGSVVNVFSSNPLSTFPQIDEERLNDLTITYQKYLIVTGGIGGNTDYPELHRALVMLDGLDLLSPQHPFLVLGLFAIIEMLITHNPKLEDRGDSITHQMQSKIPLLSNRFKSKISVEDFFGEISEKKIWAALYKYRSCVAHGGLVDFSSKELKIVKDAETVKRFLLDVVKKMIRHAFYEPQLYRDLKAC